MYTVDGLYVKDATGFWFATGAETAMDVDFDAIWPEESLATQVIVWVPAAKVPL